MQRLDCVKCGKLDVLGKAGWCSDCNEKDPRIGPDGYYTPEYVAKLMLQWDKTVHQVLKKMDEDQKKPS